MYYEIVYDMLVNVNVIYYVHVCEQAKIYVLLLLLLLFTERHDFPSSSWVGDCRMKCFVAVDLRMVSRLVEQT